MALAEVPGGTSASGGDETPPGGGLLTQLNDWLGHVPLRARLVAVIAVLLAAGLVAASFATQTIVSRFLISQVDDQLQRTSSNLNALVGTVTTARSAPSDYYVLVRTSATEGPPAFTWAPTVAFNGEPQIPAMSFDAVRARGGEPFTVRSSGGTHPTQWRVRAVIAPLTDTFPPSQVAVFVARPLSQVQDASALLARTLLLVGASIVMLGAAAAWLLVRRSLRPLQEIEATAAAIAAGDMARRVSAGPPTTEVGSLGMSLNAMLAHIERAFAVREESERRMHRFVSDASHELRTPLATIRGYGELYRMGALDTGDKVDDTMGRIEDAARRMGTLVNDLLELARMDEGRPLRSELVDLVAMADDAAQDLRALDRTRTVTVVGLGGSGDAGVPAPPSSLVVTGDADRLRQVLTNLVGNVARHTPEGTAAQIALGTTLDDAPAGRESVVLEVRDHGPGVTPEQAARMFERFYRADSSRNRESGGSGLGLAIVAAIVGAHGGHVETRSPEGGGLVVRILLPATSSASTPVTP
ncbi:HAMP domain-containing histidine kinase [Xylanimonas allomyrinae]|uniref:histidine kinase n=1 Tax=Xylanimonas allomyrinae TaxID=2509459 RepID=A0A4P6EPC3_9MICO|nr:HAMP domain-containing sensor histidine kinase [Xylanimonas allomyrinae]QAY63633.1 HAMP domain-containing histidine kinase [Xylanimonas allomyrinae]